MHSDCLDFRKLPGQNPVFLDYLFNFERVKGLFAAPPFDTDSLQARAREVLSRYRFPRRDLVSRLTTFNREMGAGEATERHLELLSGDDTLAVVSGQQVGLFGGPAYTLYKAATAVKLAAWLRENGVSAVPVFWMAADDSDFEEVRTATFFRRDAQLVSFRHADTRAHKETMAGAAQLNIEGELDVLRSTLDGFTYGNEISGLLGRCYRSGGSFAGAFANLLSRVFNKHGLILFDSRDATTRRRVGGFFATAVRRREEIVERLLQRDRELRALGLQSQVAVDPQETLLFYLRENERYKLRFEHGRFQAKDRKGLRFSPSELEAEARERPENFGFNALLRPVLQDCIFPTALYVGGPAEVAYFAQVNSIASLWDVRPVIQARAGFSVLDRKSQRLMEKYHLSGEQVLTSEEHDLAETILQQGEQELVLKLFDAWEASTGTQVAALQRYLRQMDPPLVDMLANSGSKIEYQIRKVRQRFVTNQRSQAPHLKAHLSHLLNRLRPKGIPQERHFTFTQFLAEEGLGWLDRLLDEISPDCPSHRIWRV